MVAEQFRNRHARVTGAMAATERAGRWRNLIRPLRRVHRYVHSGETLAEAELLCHGRRHWGEICRMLGPARQLRSLADGLRMTTGQNTGCRPPPEKPLAGPGLAVSDFAGRAQLDSRAEERFL